MQYSAVADTLSSTIPTRHSDAAAGAVNAPLGDRQRGVKCRVRDGSIIPEVGGAVLCVKAERVGRLRVSFELELGAGLS